MSPLTCVWWWLLVLHRIDANHRDAALWWLPFWGLAGLNWIDISCPCGTHWFWRPFIYTPLKYRDIGLILHELRVLETLLSYIMVIGGNFTHILFPSKVYIIFKGTSIYLHLCHSKFCNTMYPLFGTLVPFASWHRFKQLCLKVKQYFFFDSCNIKWKKVFNKVLWSLASTKIVNSMTSIVGVPTAGCG